MESGQITFRAASPNSYASWNALTNATGCSVAASPLACVRALPAAIVKDVIEHLAVSFAPIPDDYTFVSNRTAARLSGNIAEIPTLQGSNGDEGTLFNYGQTNVTAYLDRTLPTVPQSYKDLILTYYPIGSPGISNSYEQIAKIDTEFRFQCTSARVAKDAKSVGLPTWRYGPIYTHSTHFVLTDSDTSTMQHSTTSSSFQVPRPSTAQRYHSSSAHTYLLAVLQLFKRS